MKLDKKYLDLKLYPNKSLNKSGFFLVRLLFFLVTATVSIYFTLLGAWPVGIFLMADFFLICFALGKTFKNTKIYHRIILREKLFIKKITKNGYVKEFSIDPSWIRLKVCYYNNTGHLDIISKGKSIKIGDFLNVTELKSLAKIIKKALIKREAEIISL